jgi:CRISPR/Cas system-associated exonuclease Cas4 (RecB family)
MTKNLLKQIMLKPDEPSKILDTEALIAKINSGYIAKRGPKHQVKKTFAPSTLVWSHGECARYWYLAFEGNVFESNDTPYGVANMTAGTKSHDRIQQAMLDAEVAVAYLDEEETKKAGEEVYTTEFKVINNDPPIFGYGDAMIKWEGEEIIGEIKTMPSDAFEYFKSMGRPKVGHLMQLLLYMKILDKSKGVMIYENKNSHDLLAFPIEVNDNYIAWINNTFDWLRTVRKAWKEKTMPQKNYRSNSKICKGCPLKTACSTAEPGVIKIPPLEALSETV